jgi:hypothetical protein
MDNPPFVDDMPMQIALKSSGMNAMFDHTRGCKIQANSDVFAAPLPIERSLRLWVRCTGMDVRNPKLIKFEAC